MEPQFKITAWKAKDWHHQAGGTDEGRPEVPAAKRFINAASERHRLVSELQPDTIKETERLVDLTQNTEHSVGAALQRSHAAPPHTHASRA